MTAFGMAGAGTGNGQGGIRTHETGIPPTRSPGAPLQPLEHPSKSGKSPPAVNLACQVHLPKPWLSGSRFSSGLTKPPTCPRNRDRYTGMLILA